MTAGLVMGAGSHEGHAMMVTMSVGRYAAPPGGWRDALARRDSRFSAERGLRRWHAGRSVKPIDHDAAQQLATITGTASAGTEVIHRITTADDARLELAGVQAASHGAGR